MSLSLLSKYKKGLDKPTNLPIELGIHFQQDLADPKSTVMLLTTLPIHT